MKTLILSFTCITCLLFATNDYWEGKEYHKYSSSQKNAASDLMKYIPLEGWESILDIGCGDGKITAKLSESIPNGKILGVDISPSMVNFASKTFDKGEYTNLDFKLLAAENLNFTCKYDVILSFTAFQWITDHQLVLKNVQNSLNSKGLFGVTMPMGLPVNLETAVNEVLLNKKWASYFTDFDTGWNFIEKVSYESLLKEEGFNIRRIQIIKQEDIFPSVEVFRNFISQWFPYLRPLPVELKKEFLDAVLNRYIELEPLDSLGKLHFKIDRIEVIAEGS